MTVITKPLSEKKEKLGEPLVPAECLPHRDVERAASSGDVPSVDPRVLVLRARARRASSITTAVLFMMAMLVLCCGILGGFYLYQQFAHSQSEIAQWQEEMFKKESIKEEIRRRKFDEEKARFQQEIVNSPVIAVNRLRGWCRIPYAEQSFERLEDFSGYAENKDNRMTLEMPKPESRYMKEEFDIDGDTNSYEKISVPTFDGGRSSRFIHDFNTNKTGIIDVEARRCFVMPLNRTQVLPPRDLIDLVRKMWDGYYDVDTDMVKESMRVVLPPIQDPETAGPYIARECDGYPIYKLEKIVSGVFKRSIAHDPATFTYYPGKIYVQLKIENEEELAAYEAAHPRT